MPRKTTGYKQPTAEILSIGNELLIGHTLDTNSNWIAKRLNQIGWQLQRVTQLRDSLDAISNGVRESISRRPNILITLGGLGPTHDDMTMAGIALALHRPLKVNREAIRLVKDHYRRLENRPSLTRYRTKMATLPQGAEPVMNPVGTAPGVKIQQSKTTIFSLPGVPSEMREIFQGSIMPFLKLSGHLGHSEIQIKIAGVIESALAPALDRARRRYPGLYFKSHPRGRETGIRPLILLHIYSVRPDSSGKVEVATREILRQLSKMDRS
jgi:nicotinamide-nucleotide amidase